jgi:hypothetical protein
MQTTKTAEGIDIAKNAPVRTTRGSGLVQVIDFHGLSRSMQERFAACARGDASPAPIAVAPLRSVAPLVFAGTIVAASVGLAFYFLRGFGDLGRAESMHRMTALPIYFACIAAIVLGVAQLVVLGMRRRALPFQRGTYIFPVTIVDARDELVRVFSLEDAQGVDRDPKDPCTVRVVTATGEVFRFPSKSESDAVELMAKLEKGREEARALKGGAEDPRITWMFTMDPLQVPRLSSPLGPRAPLARRMPSWSDRAWVIAPIAALLIAPPLRMAHNAASDAVLFARAKTTNTVEAYRNYVALGGRHSGEVTSVLLPRAELDAARADGSVEAINAYAASHPNSAIASEVEAAHKKALLDELERAKKVGTVAALQAFAKKWPDHGLEPELRAAMHSLFVPALDSYRKKPPASPEVRSFVERLFAWSEAKAHAGSAATTIQIRFRRKPGNSLRKADKMVSEHHWFIGEASYPSRYFDTAHATPREKAVGERLGKRVRDAFGPTVFSVENGPRLDDGDGPLPEVIEPTLFITHEQLWTGLFDGSITKPRGVWVDIGHKFEATFVIPGDKKPLHFELEVPEKIPQQVIKDNPEGGTVQAPLEDKIYGAMADSAFKKFEEKYLANFLPAN